MWLTTIAIIIIVINATAAIITVFRQPRDIAATWAWLLVLLLLPVIGFILYWFFGRKLSTNKLNSLATQQRLGIDQMVASQQEAVTISQESGAASPFAGAPELVRTLLQADGALITTMNRVRLLFNRQDFTKALFADLRTATHHIHIEAYTIEPDGVGKALVQLLTQKAEQGVRVRVIYDTFGSHRLNRAFWRPLVQAGGQVEPFLATRLGRANLRINFRNHRKITVIDGQVAYMGGFDIGSTSRKLAITRDTQLRLTGQAVASLQARFFMDWNTTAKIKKVHFQKAYFPDPADNGRTTMQIVGGGPEQKLEAIKLGDLRLLALAKRRIWVQSPFFVPDDSLLDALVLAAQSGIDVRVMVPVHTNQPMMAKATEFYLNQLVKAGVRVYRYQAGFLHSKAIIVDSQYLMTGSPNLDVRSFKLNFEIAAFIYDQTLAEMVERQFKLDMAQATPYTYAMVKNQSHASQLGADLARLFAPIL
ncbi:cardiolipin synthase [Lacticaseibacillus camelliae]|uniref:Cardiolipin synthase n=2 Tax=Lacticaseibacillus camelliae TaxID=381742 RepID=A0A0R2FB43_9LACO|nr:cardiolipin synthase [Lacticaseibacillus camelliae]KRN25592.1 cardiolipin synthetase [Lacticaseibacillus camelliae DSM 22697 = JCM 13995]